jgi:DNA-binding HxlR family transcriptional regulator
MAALPAAYNASCTLARSLEVIGARWSLLILREAHNGITRFGDFREILGIAPDVLSDRLASLVEAGVLEKQRYQPAGGRPRDEYVLTQSGRELKLALSALQDWGDKYAQSEFGKTVTRRHVTDGAEVRVAFVDGEGRVVPDDEVYSEPKAGTPSETLFLRRGELRERAAASR